MRTLDQIKQLMESHLKKHKFQYLLTLAVTITVPFVIYYMQRVDQRESFRDFAIEVFKEDRAFHLERYRELETELERTRDDLVNVKIDLAIVRTQQNQRNRQARQKLVNLEAQVSKLEREVDLLKAERDQMKDLIEHNLTLLVNNGLGKSLPKDLQSTIELLEERTVRQFLGKGSTHSISLHVLDTPKQVFEFVMTHRLAEIGIIRQVRTSKTEFVMTWRDYRPRPGTAALREFEYQKIPTDVKDGQEPYFFNLHEYMDWYRSNWKDRIGVLQSSTMMSGK